MSVNQRIGYTRVSTEDQQRDLEREALRQPGCKAVNEAAASDSNAARLKRGQCRKSLRSGNTQLVWRFDRVGCSPPAPAGIVADLDQSGIGLEKLIGTIESTCAAGSWVWAALAEFERRLIRERTRAGLAAVHAQGRSDGRKSRLGDGTIRGIQARLRDPGLQIGAVGRCYGLSHTTFFRRVGFLAPQHA